MSFCTFKYSCNKGGKNYIQNVQKGSVIPELQLNNV